MIRARLLLLAVAVLAILTVIAAIRRGGEHAGAARVTAKVEHQHAQAAADARTDERTAARTSARIAASTARSDALSTAYVQATIQDLRNALDAVPPAADGSPLPAAPVDGLRDRLNAGIDRANRAGATADALP